MNRPRTVWILFSLCLAVVLTAMGWLTVTALRLERAQLRASERAETEERVRLALWRMESALAPLLIEESARPFSAYETFVVAEGAYTKGSGILNPAPRGDVLVPSPLLAFSSSNVLLHFQFTQDERITSPQAPTGEQRTLMDTNDAARARIERATARLEKLRAILNEQPRRPESVVESPSLVLPVAGSPAFNNGAVLWNESGAPVGSNALQLPSTALAANYDFRQVERVQQARNTIEYAQRANVSQQAQEQVFANNFKVLPSVPQSPLASPPNEGIFKPMWLDSALILARRASQETGFVVQGVWLNWSNLRQSLLALVKDLFPSADLQAVLRPNGGREERMLAALPIRLVPGPVPFESASRWTPVRVSLGLAWISMLVAGVAVALLLQGALALSERRAAFVSAVTHELRTPLTTFKMYSEMLAGGMVPDADRRKEYLETLCAEANRLNHLVENVLAYARLERGSARRRLEKVTLDQLLERVSPRLIQRAEQGGLALRQDLDPNALGTRVHVDVAVVEQILFNLVDNACKYAAPHGAEKIIHLEALRENGQWAMLRLRDHGQGISEAGAKSLFRPFRKSVQEAAQSAPGVGLGLALCRRLSRSMGGDLRLDPTVRNGACFVLRLPCGVS